MSRAVSLVLVLAIALGPVGCRSSVSPASAEGGLSGKLTLTGSSTMAPLAAEIARRFEQRYPDVRVDVQAGGSSKGIADARSGLADIGMASRELKAGEEDLTAHQIAADGVGLIVHQTNPVEEVAGDELTAIYTDQVNNWSELGGPELATNVVHKAEGRATLEVFLDHFGLENPQVKPDVIAGHNEQAIKTVAGAPGAIGYVSIGTAEAEADAGVEIKLLPLGGVAATTQNVASGEFPMSRPLNLVTDGAPSPLAEAFLQYAQSKAVHDIVKGQYFVPVPR